MSGTAQPLPGSALEAGGRAGAEEDGAGAAATSAADFPPAPLLSARGQDEGRNGVARQIAAADVWLKAGAHKKPAARVFCRN